MFKNLFKRKRDRNPFEELFPLTQENREMIELKVRGIQKQMFSEEGFEKMINEKRDYTKNVIEYKSLKLDNFNWEKSEEDNTGETYFNEYGDFLVINTIQPNGQIEKDAPSQIEVYRNWLRELFVKENGGIILCEEVELPSGVELYESIG